MMSFFEDCNEKQEIPLHRKASHPIYAKHPQFPQQGPPQSQDDDLSWVPPLATSSKHHRAKEDERTVVLELRRHQHNEEQDDSICSMDVTMDPKGFLGPQKSIGEAVTDVVNAAKEETPVRFEQEDFPKDFSVEKAPDCSDSESKTDNGHSEEDDDSIPAPYCKLVNESEVHKRHITKVVGNRSTSTLATEAMTRSRTTLGDSQLHTSRDSNEDWVFSPRSTTNRSLNHSLISTPQTKKEDQFVFSGLHNLSSLKSSIVDPSPGDTLINEKIQSHTDQQSVTQRNDESFHSSFTGVLHHSIPSSWFSPAAPTTTERPIKTKIIPPTFLPCVPLHNEQRRNNTKSSSLRSTTTPGHHPPVHFDPAFAMTWMRHGRTPPNKKRSTTLWSPSTPSQPNTSKQDARVDSTFGAKARQKSKSRLRPLPPKKHHDGDSAFVEDGFAITWIRHDSHKPPNKNRSATLWSPSPPPPPTAMQEDARVDHTFGAKARQKSKSRLSSLPPRKQQDDDSAFEEDGFAITWIRHDNRRASINSQKTRISDVASLSKASPQRESRTVVTQATRISDVAARNSPLLAAHALPPNGILPFRRHIDSEGNTLQNHAKPRPLSRKPRRNSIDSRSGSKRTSTRPSGSGSVGRHAGLKCDLATNMEPPECGPLHSSLAALSSSQEWRPATPGRRRPRLGERRRSHGSTSMANRMDCQAPAVSKTPATTVMESPSKSSSRKTQSTASSSGSVSLSDHFRLTPRAEKHPHVVGLSQSNNDEISDTNAVIVPTRRVWKTKAVKQTRRRSHTANASSTTGLLAHVAARTRTVDSPVSRSHLNL